MSMGMYLLYLLASDRIGMHIITSFSPSPLADFHTELESISSHEQANAYIKYPVWSFTYLSIIFILDPA